MKLGRENHCERELVRSTTKRGTVTTPLCGMCIFVCLSVCVPGELAVACQLMDPTKSYRKNKALNETKSSKYS